jgi:transcriptional regulator with XRE-family HTH domain
VNIKKLRERYDLTQQELAEIAGVTNKAVSSWESGNSEPRMGAIEKISKKFGIKKACIIEDGGMEVNFPEQSTSISAYFNSEEFTDKELKEIIEFAEFIKSKRK